MNKKTVILIFISLLMLVRPDWVYSVPIPNPVDGLFRAATRPLTKATVNKIVGLTGKPVVQKAAVDRFCLLMAGVQTGFSLSKIDPQLIVELTQDRFSEPLNSSNYLMSMVELLTDPYSTTIRLRGQKSDLKFMYHDEVTRQYGVTLKREIWPMIEGGQHFQTTLWRYVEFDPLNRNVTGIRGGGRFSSTETNLDNLILKFESIVEDTRELLHSPKSKDVLRTLITDRYRQEASTNITGDERAREIQMDLNKALQSIEEAEKIIRRGIFKRTLLNGATFEELRIQQELIFLHELIDQIEYVFKTIFQNPENVLAYLESINESLNFMVSVSPYKPKDLPLEKLTDWQKRLTLQQTGTLLELLGFKVQIPSPEFNSIFTRTLTDIEAQIETLVAHYEELVTHSPISHLYPGTTDALDLRVFSLWQTLQRLRSGYSMQLDSGPSDTWVDNLTPEQAVANPGIIQEIFSYFERKRVMRDYQYLQPPANGYKNGGSS